MNGHSLFCTEEHHSMRILSPCRVLGPYPVTPQRLVKPDRVFCDPASTCQNMRPFLAMRHGAWRDTVLFSCGRHGGVLQSEPIIDRAQLLRLDADVLRRVGNSLDQPD